MGRDSNPLGRRVRRKDFIRGLQSAIEWNGDFDERTAVQDDDRWDSVAVMSAVMYINESVGTIVAAEALQRARTVSDVVGLVAPDLAE